jgi:hypothetical protein
LKDKLKKGNKNNYIDDIYDIDDIIEEYMEQTKDSGQLIDEFTQSSNNYSTIKIPLMKILKNINSELNKNKIMLILDNTIDRVNQLVIHTYNFLRLFNLMTNQKINNNFIKITPDIVMIVMKVFIKDTNKGRQLLGENKTLYDFFIDFYEKQYKPLYDGNKIDGKNLSGILNYIQTEIVTAIENNIKLHFNDYINRFVNSSFKNEHNNLLNNLKGKERDELKNKLDYERRLIKNDLMNLTKTRDPKYDEWFYDWNYKILPLLDIEYTKNYHCYLKTNPQEFLICMKRMSIQISKLGYNTFQYFPLRTTIIPKYIPLDTKSIIELFMDDKAKYFSDIDKYKEQIWNKMFNLKNKVFFQKKYVFDYKISTDGYIVSLQFINRRNIDKRGLKKENIKKGQEKAREEYANLERSKIEDLKRKKQEKNDQFKRDKIEKTHEIKEKFKKLNKKEKESIINEIKLKKQVDFPYLEELTERQIENLKKKIKELKVVYNDCGKKVPVNLMDDEGNYFRYTNKEILYETKRIEYLIKIQKYKNENNISNQEAELSGYKSKSCNIEEFKEYIKKKNEINIILIKEYKEEIFRKYKWYGFINRERSEDRLIEKIKKKYGKDLIIIYGDWSVGQQMRNFISTPNNRLKRKLSKEFTIYMIDEYKTSQINYKTGKKNENLYLPDKTGTLRKIHSVLTYKMENGRLGCINRDKSATKSMKYITNYFLQTRERPKIYKRGKKEEKNNIKEIKNTADQNIITNIKVQCKKISKKQVINKKKEDKEYKKNELLKCQTVPMIQTNV